MLLICLCTVKKCCMTSTQNKTIKRVCRFVCLLLNWPSQSISCSSVRPKIVPNEIQIIQKGEKNLVYFLSRYFFFWPKIVPLFLWDSTCIRKLLSLIKNWNSLVNIVKRWLYEIQIFLAFRMNGWYLKYFQSDKVFFQPEQSKLF